jgi:phosphoadenosine phosphosulfate reductase
MSDHAALAVRINATRALLGDIVSEFSRPVFSTSFGAEDMVLFDLIARDFRGIAIATLDTGRLPPETYQLWQQAIERYRFKVEPFFPEAPAVEQYVRIYGVNGFYNSVTERKACCEVRKVEPLKRLLVGRDAWITGLRRGQSQQRAQVAFRETDVNSGLAKFNPLADWSEQDVWQYLHEHNVPTHALHAQGYPSIGCAPCTRAVAPGEDLRAGRWWWESDAQKECGLHVAAEASA